MLRGNITRVVAHAFLLAVLLDLPASAQSAKLTYQNRGRYREGVRTAPSTGAAGLDLIAALVDYREPYSSLPSSFRALFYLPEQQAVDLTIRESESRYFYWLDDVHSEPGWQAGKPNWFEWSTATVIRFLNWKSGPLTLDDLAATARLRRSTPGQVEWVAPVVLYHSRPPQSVDGYSFIFRPDTRVRVSFEVFAERGDSALGSQSFPSLLANKPHRVNWSAKGWPDGWYRLVVKGYALSDNAEVHEIVRFYHARRLGS